MPKLWRALVMGWLQLGSMAILVTSAGFAPADASAQANDDFVQLRDLTPIGVVESRAIGDALLLSSGTMLSGRDYADFVLRFDYRLPSTSAGASLLLRAHKGSDGTARHYAVTLDGTGQSARVLAVELPLSVRPALAPRRWTPTKWTDCEVRIERAFLTVRIAGTVVATGSVLDKPPGRVGFRVDRDGIELRDVRVAPITQAPFHPELSYGGFGVTSPVKIRDVAPIYPDEARRKRLSGTVMLDIEVRADGRVGDIRLASSPHSELVASAIACVKQWRFTPATKAGVPVAVTATAEVAFNLTP